MYLYEVSGYIDLYQHVMDDFEEYIEHPEKITALSPDFRLHIKKSEVIEETDDYYVRIDENEEEVTVYKEATDEEIDVDEEAMGLVQVYGELPRYNAEVVVVLENVEEAKQQLADAILKRIHVELFRSQALKKSLENHNKWVVITKEL